MGIRAENITKNIGGVMTVRNLQTTNNRQVAQAPARSNGGLNAIHDEMNDLFSNFFGRSLPSLWNRQESLAAVATPAVDVSENDKEIRIAAELPGIESKDVDVDITENYITIRGEKRDEHKEEKEGYYRRERSYGSFQRTVALPDYADADNAVAEMKNGVLTIAVPKKKEAQKQSRKLEIKQN
jgi:HSP20 family protein